MGWLLMLGWISAGTVLGVLSGFMGIGGGLILTPLLLYIGMSPAVASVTSLAFIIPTAWAGMMRSKDDIDVTLTILLTVGAVVGTYCLGRPLVESCNLSPTLYKRIFGAILLLVALDMVSGFSESLKPKMATVPRDQVVPAQSHMQPAAFGLLPQERPSHP